jgi:DNA-binding XRE family transcriptional regulator
MTAVFPVHPDDVDQLLKIRRYLIGYRITNGWTQQELSQRISGMTGKGWVYDLEGSKTWQWRFSRLQDWTVPFGLRLKARLRFSGALVDDPPVYGDPDEQRDLTFAIDSHPEVAPMLSLSLKQEAWRTWQRMYLTSALSVARRELGISTADMGVRLGVGASAVRNWENVANEIMLPKVLAYARALGGAIELGLQEA